MKKLIIFTLGILLISLSACNRTTTSTTTMDSTDLPTTIVSTTFVTTSTEVVTTDFTTIINEEITIRLNGGIDTVEINSEWIDAGADLLINDVAHAMLTIDNVDETEFGLYKIHYAYTYKEVVYEIDRYVIVVDQTPPIITLNLGVDTVTQGEEWIDAGAQAIDNSGETVTVTTSGVVNINTLGTYIITYTATDSSDNTSLIYRYVTVVE